MPSFVRVRKVTASQRYQSPGAETMQQVGDAIIPQLVRRTQSGIDEHRRGFAPYAKSSPKAGRRVNLTETYDMLGGMQVVQATAKTVRIGWTNKRLGRIAGFLQGGTENMPARPFVGIPKTWALTALRRLYKPWKK